MALTMQVPAPAEVDLSALTAESARELNNKWRAAAANEAYSVYVERVTDDEGTVTPTLTQAGVAFVAKMRQTKCGRAKCPNNLGQEYGSHHGRGFGTEIKELPDAVILRRFVQFSHPQIEGSFYSQAFKASRIVTATNGEDYNRLGFCDRKCMDVQVRADDARGGPLSAAQKQALHNAGFKLRRGYSAVKWHRDENNSAIEISSQNRTMTIFGDRRHPESGAIIREEPQGTYSLDTQFDEALTAARALKSREFYEGEVHAETRPRAEEKAALEHLQTALDVEVNAFRELAKVHRSAFVNSSDPVKRAAEHAAMVAARGGLYAVERLRSDVEDRLANKKTPSASPTPYAVAEEQCASGWDKRNLAEAIAALQK